MRYTRVSVCVKMTTKLNHKYTEAILYIQFSVLHLRSEDEMSIGFVFRSDRRQVQSQL